MGKRKKCEITKTYTTQNTLITKANHKHKRITCADNRKLRLTINNLNSKHTLRFRHKYCPSSCILFPLRERKIKQKTQDRNFVILQRL